jgi:hypothetical protein
MKKALRTIAMILVVGAVGYWAAAGANNGWTKNRVQVKTTDEVTGIEAIAWQETFLPGIDFIGFAFFGAAVLTGASFFFRNKKIDRKQPN